MASEMRQGLGEYFGTAVDDDDVMEECVQICTLLNVTPEDLFFKWEAFSFSSSSKDRVISSLTLEGARDLRAHIHQQQAAEATTSKSTAQGAKIRGLPRSLTRKLPNISSSKLPLGSQAIPRGTNQLRPAASEPASTPYHPKAKHTPSPTLTGYNYRYMYERVPERSEVLDERIDDMAERVKSYYHLGDGDIGDPSVMTEKDTIVVGRICTDSEERPNESSLFIESSRILGSGKRVLLQFHQECGLVSEISGRPSFNLFPGQIVALRGRNGNGLRFVVNEILALPRLLPQAIAERSERGDADPTSLLVACGPYSSDKDLLYTPWERLVAEVQRKKPIVVVLLGPFVDINNSLIKDGAVTQTPAAYFQQYFTSKLDVLFTSVPGISIFLVPSPRDIIHDHIAFPQNTLNTEQLGIPRNIHVLSNPCVFTVNGVNIGVSSVDILSHIGTQQYSRHIKTMPESLDGMQLLALQLLEQRSFYPLFPVPAKEAVNVNLDVSHSHLLYLDTAPDLLIIPSRLKSGYRVVDRTVVVNPGFVSRGANPDSFANILVPSLGSVGIVPDTQSSGSEASKHERTDLPERIKVDIVKFDQA